MFIYYVVYQHDFGIGQYFAELDYELNTAEAITNLRAKIGSEHGVMGVVILNWKRLD